MKIRNKRTGETREVSPEDLIYYGFGSPDSLIPNATGAETGLIPKPT